MRKIRLYQYPGALSHIHDHIPGYENSVPFSKKGIADWCELVGPEDAELFYCGQFTDENRHLLAPDFFQFFKGNESKHVFDLEGDHSDSPIPEAFRDCLFTAMNATQDKREWKLLVRPPCSMLLMDMVWRPRPETKKEHGYCFIGKRDSNGFREAIYETVRDAINVYWEWTDKWNAMTSIDSPAVQHYEEEMMRWTHALCPPGEGQATVRYYEACGFGMDPIPCGSTGLLFMPNLAPPQLPPREYFSWVIRYFNDPTLFFLKYFRIAEELEVAA